MGTDQAVNELPVLENKHGRNALNSILRGDSGIFIDIQFRDFVFSTRLRSQLIEDRTDDATWTAPGRPTIDQERDVAGGGHSFGKRRVRNDDRFSTVSLLSRCKVQLGAALATNWLQIISRFLVYTIFRPTFCTIYYSH
jgi:hypothetical protein